MQRLRTLVGVLACALLVLGLCVPSFAQSSPEGRIAGLVKDAAGAVIPAANIVATDNATNAKYTATASSEGAFLIPSLPAGVYTVEVIAKGFAKGVFSQVKVEPGRDYSLIASLKVGQATETVEVQAGQELVNTTTAELSSTVTVNQINDLPLLGRDIIGLVSTQAGAGSSGRVATSINGTRPSWSQVTLDGINIQDPYIRTNALDYIPNRPTTDVVSEFTVTTGTQGADAALGANGVRMVTTSGTNSFHGGAWDYNRNSAVAANDWFNNASGTPRPFRNRNEFGGKLGGPVLKNKLFFYGFYVGIRDRQASQRNNVIPAHNDYLTGQFRYLAGGAVQNVNIITGAGLTSSASTLTPMSIDPKVQALFLSKVVSASNVNNRTVGNSTAADLLNTAGYIQNVSANYNRDNYGWKVDYDLNTSHHFDFTYNHMHEVTVRPTYDPVNASSAITNDSSPKLFSGAWRYRINDTLINTVRIGANLANAPFASSYKNTEGFVWNTNATSWSSTTPITATGIAITPPQVSFQPQGRNPAVHQYMDDLSWVKGNHFFSFGGQFQQINIYTYNDAGVLPTITTGFDNAPWDPTAGAMNVQLTAAMFPGGISSTDLTAANALRAFLTGMLASESQTFNVASRTSGFVAGQRSARNLTVKDLSFYATDKWRVKPNLVVTYGVKWEYLSPYQEINGLALGPKWIDKNNPKATLFQPNATIDFLSTAWDKNLRDFGPTIGVAWDPFKDGKTSIRGGYTMTFVNDDIFRFAGNAADGNAGLQSSVVRNTLYQPLNGGLPTISAPAFLMPRTYADQLALSATGVVWALDPKVKTPKVHELSFGVERELPKNFALSVRYVGTLGRDLLRGIDLNQNNAAINQPFLADFNRARANYYNCNRNFNPTTTQCAAAQPLQFIPNALGGTSGGNLGNSTVSGYIQRGEIAELANYYVSRPGTYPNAQGLFLPNPGIYAIDYGTNGSESSYHALQAEVRRRFSNGFTMQANYTYGKLLSTSPIGDSGQTRFDPLLDNARPWLAKARSDYDLRHAIKGNFIYDLPVGKGKMLLGNANGIADRFVGGWQMSSILTWQSGNPFSILSNRGSFNRQGRSSGLNTALSSLTQEQIKGLLGVYRAADGTMYYINPSVINTDGRAVGADNLNNTAGFANQVFFNPMAGQIGGLGVLAFDAPAYMNVDFGMAKRTKITERFNTTFRADFFNLLNHPTFYLGDQNINSASFGKIGTTNTSARVIQFSLKVDF